MNIKKISTISFVQQKDSRGEDLKETNLVQNRVKDIKTAKLKPQPVKDELVKENPTENNKNNDKNKKTV